MVPAFTGPCLVGDQGVKGSNRPILGSPKSYICPRGEAWLPSAGTDIELGFEGGERIHGQIRESQGMGPHTLNICTVTDAKRKEASGRPAQEIGR